MADELLDALDRDGRILKTGSKKNILNEQRQVAFDTGESPYAVPVVYLVLHHPEKGVYIVQRAEKSVDPRLWAETISGHISHGEQPDETMIREGKEEGGIDIVIAQSTDEYFARVGRERGELWKQALVRKIHIDPELKVFRVDRDTHQRWLKWSRAHIYLGVFHGNLTLTPKSDAPDFSDGLGEALDWKIMPHDALRQSVAENDPNYTQSLAMIINRYGSLF